MQRTVDPVNGKKVAARLPALRAGRVLGRMKIPDTQFY
jgi:hypothetical protein